MKLNVIGGLLTVLVLVALIVGYGSIFTVYQTDQAIVVQLGEPVRVVSDPGLHFKVPFFQSVISIDRRILDLENPAQEVIASDGDMMEGISHEASALAGHLCLSKLTVLYDDNHVSIDGDTAQAYSDDVLKRFSAYGWAARRIDGSRRSQAGRG